MTQYYTDERHAQIVVKLLKEHNVRKIVVSPGATNIPIVASVQYDEFFEVYSCVDERSAAYIACGLAEESGEIVAISCTGATASRNYLPALTEAFYRKLPILAITSFNGNDSIGQLLPQNIDRTVIPNDVAKLSVQLPVVKDEKDEKFCNLLVNKAILEATRQGGGPVHINLTTTYLGTFKTKILPEQRVIKRFNSSDTLPDINYDKIAIFIGSHKTFSDSEVEAIESFCKHRNAVVLCDHTSSYKGKFSIQSALIKSNVRKLNPLWESLRPNLVVHLGEVSGDYPSMKVLEEADAVWRVSPDGEIRDRGGKLVLVYEGDELSFFNKLSNGSQKNEYFNIWKSTDAAIRELIPELPFSNSWISKEFSKLVPRNSYVNLAILNTLRNWNFCELDPSVYTTSNVGGFGIDGCMSTMVGASLVNKNKLYFGVIGDLAYFYDVNVIANRHLSNNVRILLINNGCGAEFNVSTHIGSVFGEKSTDFISAGGHFASGSGATSVVEDKENRTKSSLSAAWAEKLGFKYYSAKSKSEFLNEVDKFIDHESDQPIILECFTNSNDESHALDLMNNISLSNKEKYANSLKGKIPTSLLKLVRKYK